MRALMPIGRQRFGSEANVACLGWHSQSLASLLHQPKSCVKIGQLSIFGLFQAASLNLNLTNSSSSGQVAESLINYGVSWPQQGKPKSTPSLAGTLTGQPKKSGQWQNI